MLVAKELGGYSIYPFNDIHGARIIISSPICPRENGCTILLINDSLGGAQEACGMAEAFLKAAEIAEKLDRREVVNVD